MYNAFKTNKFKMVEMSTSGEMGLNQVVVVVVVVLGFLTIKTVHEA